MVIWKQILIQFSVTVRHDKNSERKLQAAGDGQIYILDWERRKIPILETLAQVELNRNKIDRYEYF